MDGDDQDGSLFTVTTRLSFDVRVTDRQWQKIILEKHPVMAGREGDVRAVLSDPEEVRQSKRDSKVFLFYRRERPGRWLSVVVKKGDNKDGFLVTAYPTDAIKEGERIWTK